MTKKKSTISINIISALIILISIFIGIVGPTNAWFTYTQSNGVEIIVSVGELKLNLFQKIGNADRNEVFTYDENKDKDEDKKSYVVLSGPIAPGEKMALNLQLDNTASGSAPMYVRFRFQVFLRNTATDTSIPTKALLELDNMPEKYFKQNNGAAFDDYYYYQDASGNALLERNSSVVMMTHFECDFDSMFGDQKYAESDTVYIKLKIEASLTNWVS